MFIKIRRDTLIILLLAFILILSGRLVTYMAYASSEDIVDGVPVSGILVKGNDIVPLDYIRSNVESAGFRTGSYVKGNLLITDQKEVPLAEAINNAEKFATYSTIPGTSLQPIAAASASFDKSSGILTITVIEDYTTLEVEGTKK